jgi:hypothetical protein
MQTRREFIAGAAAAGAAIVASSLAPAMIFAAPPLARPAVVSIHMDQPYIDMTGRAIPYHPPAGARSGDPVAHFTEAQFRSSYPGL